MRHIGIVGNLTAAAALLALGRAAETEAERPTAVPMKPRRNYDLQGPEPKAGPPTQVEADVPSRQQRRRAERLAAKKHR